MLWSPLALDDLNEITAYIAEDNTNAALTILKKFKTAAKRVSSFPMSGRIIPEYDDDLRREVIVGNYRMQYIVLEGRIEIAQITHGARLLDNPEEDLDK